MYLILNGVNRKLYCNEFQKNSLLSLCFKLMGLIMGFFKFYTCSIKTDYHNEPIDEENSIGFNDRPKSTNIAIT